MPFGALAPAIGHLARFGVTAQSGRSALGQFAQALPFGAGYSFGTYVGFPKNYYKKNSLRNRYNTLITRVNASMPFGRSYSRRYSRRYSRYPRRYSRYPRRSYRSYRRYY